MPLSRRLGFRLLDVLACWAEQGEGLDEVDEVAAEKKRKDSAWIFRNLNTAGDGTGALKRVVRMTCTRFATSLPGLTSSLQLKKLSGIPDLRAESADWAGVSTWTPHHLHLYHQIWRRAICHRNTQTWRARLVMSRTIPMIKYISSRGERDHS